MVVVVAAAAVVAAAVAAAAVAVVVVVVVAEQIGTQLEKGKEKGKETRYTGAAQSPTLSVGYPVRPHKSIL